MLRSATSSIGANFAVAVCSAEDYAPIGDLIERSCLELSCFAVAALYEAAHRSFVQDCADCFGLERRAAYAAAVRLSARSRSFHSAHRPMETKMRTRVLTVLGVFLVAASMSQIEMAAARGIRTAPHAATQQLRDGVPSRPEHHGMSAPAAVDNRSCDIFWCYGR